MHACVCFEKQICRVFLGLTLSLCFCISSSWDLALRDSVPKFELQPFFCWLLVCFADVFTLYHFLLFLILCSVTAQIWPLKCRTWSCNASSSSISPGNTLNHFLWFVLSYATIQKFEVCKMFLKEIKRKYSEIFLQFKIIYLNVFIKNVFLWWQSWIFSST